MAISIGNLKPPTHFLGNSMGWGTGVHMWGNRLPAAGGTDRPQNLKAFLITESKNPFLASLVRE